MRLYGDSELSRLIYLNYFEFQERIFTLRVLRDRDFFVDVGANIGLFTLIAASRVGNQGAVWSFEPVRGTYCRLAENVELNGFHNVSAIRLALSDASGFSRIIRAGAGFDAWNSMGRPYMGGIEAEEQVETTTWDEFALSHQLVGRVTMMKIDVEGWESRVLQGAAKTLQRDDAPVLLVEFTEKAANAAGSSCTELFKLIESFGYHLYDFDLGAGILHRVLRGDLVDQRNLVATKHTGWVIDRLRGNAVDETF